MLRGLFPLLVFAVLAAAPPRAPAADAKVIDGSVLTEIRKTFQRRQQRLETISVEFESRWTLGPGSPKPSANAEDPAAAESGTEHHELILDGHRLRVPKRAIRRRASMSSTGNCRASTSRIRLRPHG